MNNRGIALLTVAFLAGGVASDAANIGLEGFQSVTSDTLAAFCSGPVGTTCEFIVVAGSSCASGNVVSGPSSFELRRAGRSQFRLSLPVGFPPATGAFITLCGTVDLPGGRRSIEREETFALGYGALVPASVVDKLGLAAPPSIRVQPHGDINVRITLRHPKGTPVETTIETTLRLPDGTAGSAVSLAAGDGSCNGTPISDTVTTKSTGGTSPLALQLNALGQQLLAKYRRLQAILCSMAQDASGTTVAVKKRHVTLLRSSS
jgi:hypothetical protein